MAACQPGAVPFRYGNRARLREWPVLEESVPLRRRTAEAAEHAEDFPEILSAGSAISAVIVVVGRS